MLEGLLILPLSLTRLLASFGLRTAVLLDRVDVTGPNGPNCDGDVAHAAKYVRVGTAVRQGRILDDDCRKSARASFVHAPSIKPKVLRAHELLQVVVVDCLPVGENAGVGGEEALAVGRTLIFTAVLGRICQAQRLIALLRARKAALNSNLVGPRHP